MATNHLPSDIAVRVKVAYRESKEKVQLPTNNFTLRLVQLLYVQGLIGGWYITSEGYVQVKLKYVHTKPLIKNISVVSCPGSRVYANMRALSLRHTQGNPAIIYIISTPQGLYTNSESLTALHNVGEIVYKIQLH